MGEAMSLTDDERARWRELNRERRANMTDRALMLEVLERQDAIAHLLSSALADMQAAKREANDARKISSTALYAVRHDTSPSMPAFRASDDEPTEPGR
jgi:hypothetical protein